MNFEHDIRILTDQCVFARSVYLHGRTLFEESSAADSDRMKRAAPIFFVI
jgi:hypothetical protein